MDNPYAVAWASYNDESNPNHGKGGLFSTKSNVKGLGGKSKSKGSTGKKTPAPKKTKTKKMRLSLDPVLAHMLEAELKTKKRNKLPKKSFAVPGERKFPIHDASHARNALARASGTKYEKRVRAAVHKRYPKIGAEANSAGGLPQTLRGQREMDYKCGVTDWGNSHKDMEGGPGSGRRPYGSNAQAKRVGRKVSGQLNKMKRGFTSFKHPRIQSRMKTLVNRLRIARAYGATQADKKILKILLKESVEAKTYRFSESALMEVVAPVQPAARPNRAPEGKITKCVLITEGLGNRSDMHYYGPECIKQGAPLFEGEPCFIDHQTKSEQTERPERTVRDKCGYFKNVHIEEVDGRLGLCAELHYDLSETGNYAYDKACTAIHYREEFGESGKEYVGLSIAADGDLEERTVQVGDEVLDVKYVTRFTRVGSVDQVTSPARGGRFLKVLKSDIG